MSAKTQSKPNFFSRFLNFVEWAGNLLPHPVTLFAYFTLAIILLSGLAEWMGLEVIDPRPVGAKGRSADGVIKAVSLLSAEGIRWLYQNLVKNFTNFAPLGTVLVALLGVGVAEGSGLIRTAVRSFILKAPRSLVTFNLVFAGILSNTASELGYVVLIPLGGYIFKSIGRHPLAGMAATFAGVSGGYSANLLIGTLDPLLAGITQEAARLIAPEYTVHAAVNWYFMMASTFIIAAIGTWVTEKIVEPKLGNYDEKYADENDQNEEELLKKTTPLEIKGMKWAFISTLLLSVILLLCVIPENAILRDPETGAILRSPFLRGIVSSIFVFFLIPGVVYGKITGAFKSDKDVINSMAKSMSTMGLYIVIVFAAAQFINCFKWTNLGLIFAVKGAQWMQELGLQGGLIFFPFIIVCALVNLSLGSASAQWAATAPIFVPMLMLLGFSPEVIQAAYRIGDSSTNIITPMMSYFGLILAFAYRFDKRTGVGTIISTMLPYSILFMLAWSILFYVWVFVFGLPVGPGAPTYFTP
ncbi:AbgT family transporter [bacterium]|nr:AbgT family transporter [bacterium]